MEFSNIVESRKLDLDLINYYLSLEKYEYILDYEDIPNDLRYLIFFNKHKTSPNNEYTFINEKEMCIILMNHKIKSLKKRKFI